MADYLAIILGFSGVVIGFILNELNSFLKEKKKEKKLTKNIRTLISLEISQNLELLNKLLENFGNIDREKNPTEHFINFDLAQRLINLPLPPWRHIRWDSQTIELASALNEYEINRIANFYNDLDALNSIQSKLHDLENKYKPPKEIPEQRDPVFQKKAVDYFKKYRTITEEIIKKGNPLI
ncbi:MAG: hypothetical protein FGO69_08440 [Methanobacterium sp.]|jgi:hypothetical protein|nr:MAG: hypothetical protein FGO69_08440 [Methanobacterium sp.]